MPRVFVIERTKSTMDLSTAAAYGELVVVFDRDHRRTSVFNTVAYGEAIRERLDELGFDPATDYICIVGSMVTTTVFAMATLVAYKCVNFLFFDAMHSSYIDRVISVDDWSTGDIDARQDNTVQHHS